MKVRYRNPEDRYHALDTLRWKDGHEEMFLLTFWQQRLDKFLVIEANTP